MIDQKTYSTEDAPADASLREWEAVRVTTGERKLFRRWEEACEWIEEAEVGCFGFEISRTTSTRGEVWLA